ncbi:MAG: SAM-dependent chlorinase/fluorinase [Candidatus Hydrogenedentota bacterium]
MNRGIVTFTSDFGLKDAYVAEMKGAFLAELDRLGWTSGIQLIDVTHELPRHAIGQAAELLRPLAAVYPEKSVHVVVVDPGVGSDRWPMFLRTRGQYFVGPDNGIFTRLLPESDLVLRIDERQRRESGSAVFDGRDLFAPVAARLIAGVDPSSLGSTLAEPVRLTPPLPVRAAHSIRGQILGSDHFGNMRTNIPVRDIPFGARVSVGSASRLPIHCSYSESDTGAPAGIISSDGSLEIAVREGSAAEILKCGVGDEVLVEWS